MRRQDQAHLAVAAAIYSFLTSLLEAHPCLLPSLQPADPLPRPAPQMHGVLKTGGPLDDDRSTAACCACRKGDQQGLGSCLGRSVVCVQRKVGKC